MTAAARFDRDDRPHEDHFVRLHGVGWADYERIVALRGDRSAPRINYFEGELEIMSPSRSHESIKSRIGCLVEVWCLERGIDLVGAVVRVRDEDLLQLPDQPPTVLVPMPVPVAVSRGVIVFVLVLGGAHRLSSPDPAGVIRVSAHLRVYADANVCTPGCEAVPVAGGSDRASPR